jgi:glutaredoxin
MFKRFVMFLALAFIPVVVLGLIYPDKLMKGPDVTMKYPQAPGADIVAFVRDGCPHCQAFHDFAIANNWTVDYHEITDIGTGEMFEELQKVAPTLQQGVPTIIINGTITQGYDTDDASGVRVKKLYDDCKASSSGCKPYKDFLVTASNVTVHSAAEGTCTESCEADESKYIWNFPILGEINLLRMSLPALALFLGFLDGFNPCAMWVLITLLTLLINTHDMKKVWVIGGTFLFVSGAIYYLFIAAWLNVFLLIGYNMWVQKVIGLVAIAGGGFYLYEAFGKDPNQCNVSDYKSRQKTIERMKQIASYTAYPAMILGVSILAISVNMIELVCTAGLPAVFTQILAFNHVEHWYRYALIGLFIMMYMIDDLVIFAIAVYSLHATGLTTKYRRFTLIFGGALMYTLGILLIFFPNALTFH